MNDSTVEHKCEYCTANTIPKDKYPCVYCSLNEEHEPIEDRFKLCVWLYKSLKRKEIEALPSAQQWIPVSEQKPDGEVLCCNIYGDMIVGYVYKDISCDTGFGAECSGEFLENVIAWMPLPKSYKESEE